MRGSSWGFGRGMGQRNAGGAGATGVSLAEVTVISVDGRGALWWGISCCRASLLDGLGPRRVRLVPETDLFTPPCGVLIYEMSFWDNSTEVVAGLRETANLPQVRKV
jgi:hypothetical protein